jgi:hypothetical protein
MVFLLTSSSPSNLSSPADVEVSILLEEEVGEIFGMEEQVMLDVSRTCLGLCPHLSVSRETHFQMVQGSFTHKPLQLLSGEKEEEKCEREQEEKKEEKRERTKQENKE